MLWLQQFLRGIKIHINWSNCISAMHCRENTELLKRSKLYFHLQESHACFLRRKNYIRTVRDSGAFKSMLLKGLFERSCQISWSNLSLKNIHRKYYKFENLKQWTYLSKIDIATCLVFLLNIINRIVWIYVEKLWKASHFQCFHWFSPKICFVYFWVSQFA